MSTAPPILDHIGLVVEDLDAAIGRFSELLGGSVERFDDDEPLDCRWAHLRLPGSVPLELVSPRSPRSPYRRFLDQRGEGLHHVSFRIGNLEAERSRIEALGLSIVGFSADHSGWQELFVHPRETHSALIHFGIPPA